MLFVSGQLPIDPVTMQIVEGGIKEQTQRSIENVSAILKKEGMNLGNVLKVTVFISDMNNFADVNEIYSGYFTNDYPARSCVEVSCLPQNAMIEIEVIAAKG
jgi:2-iminobutanoate/2-iminopropanoate deaminase